MPEYRFTQSHEWIAEFDGRYRLGISEFAQSELGDITFVEFPDEGSELAAGESLGAIESVKAVSEYFAPVALKVVRGNPNLEDRPELVNQDPLGDGWLLEIEIANPASLDELMDATAYEALDKSH